MGLNEIKSMDIKVLDNWKDLLSWTTEQKIKALAENWYNDLKAKKVPKESLDRYLSSVQTILTNANNKYKTIESITKDLHATMKNELQIANTDITRGKVNNTLKINENWSLNDLFKTVHSPHVGRGIERL